MSELNVGDRARIIKVIDLDNDRKVITDPARAAALFGGYGPGIGDVVVITAKTLGELYDYEAEWEMEKGYETFSFLAEELEPVK
ncbi:hypothetical protein PBI_SIRHARLEY_53 [Mycobacterium phage SirHarley]|uniref:Uncharacterized protein n=1 Tax=Mycobacterium phage SirHarley TaxID=1034117 RepID=G1D663_9CAUD|nr:hypothetical protein PBI_SIRHARLEY_53 [Mycobacterium phage SirHarley]